MSAWAREKTPATGFTGINQATSVPLPQDLVLLSAPGTQVAEFGQSLSTAQLQSMHSLATQIVSLMEMPW